MNCSKPLRPIAKLSLEVKDLHQQLYKYCNTKEFAPQNEDFKDIALMRIHLKDCEHLCLVLNEYWMEKDFVK